MLRGFSVAVLLAGTAFLSACDPYEGSTREKVFVGVTTAAESGAYEALGPAGTAAELMMKSPEVTKVLLREHFARREMEAAMALDFERQERFEAHILCLDGNCDALRKLEAARARNLPAAAPAPARPTAPVRTPAGATTHQPGDGGGGSH